MKATGLIKSEASKQKDEEFKKDVELKKLSIIEDQAKAAAEQAKTATEAVKTDGKNGDSNVCTVKLCTITDQTSDDVAPVLLRSEVTAYHKVYEVKLDGKCPKSERPSVYQLSALKFLLGNDKSIYCDFAIWGPQQTRLMRKLILVGMILHEGGLKRIELKGPPTCVK